MSFLRAEWRKLGMANYVVSPDLLRADVPAGTELDIWDGKCYVSLVGFMFKHTRLLGVRVPWHVHFEEVNLRFYVRRKEGGVWKRGVVFVKEIVPKAAISWVANTLYGEHYETRRMRHQWVHTSAALRVSYEWRVGGAWQSFGLVAKPDPVEIAPDSEAEFITEHYWGYNRVSSKQTTEYQVTHPRWLQYPVVSHQVMAEFGRNYGARFAFLNQQQPDSVLLAEGSPITVEGKRTLRF